MSVNFVDQSEYANDMDELDDLTPPKDKQDIGDYVDELAGRAAPVIGPEAFDLVEVVDAPSPAKSSSSAAQLDAEAREFFNSDFDELKVPAATAKDDAGAKPKPTASVITSGTDEEQDQKRVLLVQIARYRETWPFLEEVISFPPTLHKKSVEKLEEIRNECSGRVQNRNCMKGLRIVFNGAMAQFETFVTSRFTFIELQGFAKACEMDEVVQDSIKELEIKYLSSSGVMAPEARLIMGLLLVAYSTHNKNRTTRLVQGVAHSRAPDLGKKYQDL